MDVVRQYHGLDGCAGGGTPTGAGVRVAVIDTGADTSHPALAGAFARPPVSVGPYHAALDAFGHGTAMAGVIAGRPDPATGRYAGVAPAATLLAYQVNGQDGDWPDATVAAAIDRAVNDGAHVINLSMGWKPNWLVRLALVPAPPWLWKGRDLVEEALERATAAGVLCVVAAGNDQQGPRAGTVYRAGGSERVLTVGSVRPFHWMSTGLGPTAGRELRVMPESTSARGPFRSYPDAPASGLPVRFDPARHEDAVVVEKPDLAALGVDVWVPRASAVAADPALPGHPHSLGGHYVPVDGTSVAAAIVSGLAACALERLGGASAAWPPAQVKRLLIRSCRPAHGFAGPPLSDDRWARVPFWDYIATNIEVLRRGDELA